MLKWTVMARRDAATPRRSTADPATTPKPAKPKRRHSSGHRRSGGRRPSRLSLDLAIDKENQFTSTPIKSFEHQFDALRDVSNLTPQDSANRRVLSAKKCRRSASPSSHRKHKKKKLCLDPAHKDLGEERNFFTPFESVDSHIGGVLVEGAHGAVKRRVEEMYGATLPTFAMEYSPCEWKGLSPVGYLGLDQEGLCPRKKAKIEHVGEFLHKINTVEDEKLEVKVSPLVKKLVDLRFSQLGYDSKNNNSSLINDLSLDQIVDAILNSSIESTKESKSQTQEDNLINTQNERHTSFDSGFKSTTDYSHHLEGNFQCKCKKTSTPNLALPDKTIINIDETFNERCVDEAIKPRKRASSASRDSDNNPKRVNLEDDINFTLKRQRCIRRRRTDDERKTSSSRGKITRKTDLFDDSFDSSNIVEDNGSTPLKVASLNETFTLTPVENNRRFRRCLLFESPTSLSESASTANGSLREVRGCMDLNIRCENDDLYVNGECTMGRLGIVLLLWQLSKYCSRVICVLGGSSYSGLF
ncbi:hypothetical protein Zmor_002534 [Zophobas morio]|uniref:Uncharacterized protein n=1 Tax=Zophobas morio TaxID=2755281 RepID=A0AA38J5J4_9CUCU|nr:hypothetical protein Zmor_002534 [Zophobas morio]